MRVLNGFLTLVFVSFLTVAGLTLLVASEVDKPGPLQHAVTFAVPRGEGTNELANRLEKEGIIASALTFKVQNAGERFAVLLGKPPRAAEIKAGEYEIKKGASMRQVLDTLTEGKSVLYKITIPEGLTSQQVVARIAADPNLGGSVTSAPAEGTLLPDTYRFSKGMARQELIDRMLAEHRKFITAAWEARQKELPLKTIEEALVLASIVEKETARAVERDKVAAVFVNRMRRGMRLQSDPTIIYGIAGGQGALGRPIYRGDIDQKTPYNTYQIDGLPPTAICNPGRSAIEATLNPAKTLDLYFVADGTGGHVFSATLKEHNVNVGNWRKLEKDTKAKSTEASTRAVVRTAPAPAAGIGAAVEQPTPGPAGAAAVDTRLTTPPGPVQDAEGSPSSAPNRKQKR